MNAHRDSEHGVCNRTGVHGHLDESRGELQRVEEQYDVDERHLYFVVAVEGGVGVDGVPQQVDDAYADDTGEEEPPSGPGV